MTPVVQHIMTVLTTNDVIFILGVISCVFMTIVQKASKRFKPWTWLAEQFGKAANKEMLDKLNDLEVKVDKLEKRNNEQDAKQEEEKAKAARRRILRCSDEIRLKQRHSEEYFNDVLDDITFYRHYCDTHPTFKNEKAVMAIHLVERTYNKCIEDNDFL